MINPSAPKMPSDGPNGQGGSISGGQRKPTKLQLIGALRRPLLYDHYGFRENPFGATPNPLYLYQSRTHQEAKSSLVIGVECGIGFQALIAPPGMGKTTLLFQLMQRFN